MTVKIGVPAKGRLHEQSTRWLRERGFAFATPAGGRRYSATATGIANVELVFLPASEIASELYRMNLEFGITGADLIHELPADWDRYINIQEALGFGHARLEIAVPRFWIDVDTPQDLDDVSAQFRARHGRSIRIATKYHTLARRFLQGIGMTNYRLVDSQGATEGTVANNTAEAIIDLVSTGATLEANGLKTLSNGVVFESEAVFASAKLQPKCPKELESCQKIGAWQNEHWYHSGHWPPKAKSS